MKRTNLLLILSMTLAFATSCQDNNRQNQVEEPVMEETRGMDMDEMDDDNVYTRMQEDEELSTYSMGMTRADLSDDLSEGEGPYTIFAPSDSAYEGLTQEEKDALQNQDIQQLGANTSYLVVERELTADSLRRSITNVGGEMELITMQGEQLMASIQGDDIVLRDGHGNTATVTESDRIAANGVVHVIDKVLRPVDISRNDASDLMGVDIDEDDSGTMNE